MHNLGLNLGYLCAIGFFLCAWFIRRYSAIILFLLLGANFLGKQSWPFRPQRSMKIGQARRLTYLLWEFYLEVGQASRLSEIIYFQSNLQIKVVDKIGIRMI
jgi:hypothetical protein